MVQIKIDVKFPTENKFIFIYFKLNAIYASKEYSKN